MIDKLGQIDDQTLKDFDFDINNPVSAEAGAFVLTMKKMNNDLSQNFTLNLEQMEAMASSKVIIELKTKDDRKHEDDHDDLMFATNWTRAFKKLH
jgi:hypothetical protein